MIQHVGDGLSGNGVPSGWVADWPRIVTNLFNTTMSEAYDPNFCFPLPESLESERLKLTPFIAESIILILHAGGA